jgi:hypothetical protein
MSSKIEVQLHLWPWSTGIGEETINLTTGAATFPFWGSPVLSVSTKASLFLPQRHERFVPFGPPFDTLGGKYQLYETPHGVMAGRHASKKKEGGDIKVHAANSRETVRLFPQGAKHRCFQNGDEEDGGETLLARVVLAWSQFFDNLIEDTKKTGRENKMSWSEISWVIFKIAEDITEPRMSLIVDIAERMHARVLLVVNAARKILLREQRMLPAGRVTETDTACLRWFVRQPGENMAQKAAANRQRLLGIARHDSFDTLENRVLKDFLSRCMHEGLRYLKTEVGDEQLLKGSMRARTVRKYWHLCSGLHQAPHLEMVGKPPPAPRPNYVLQNDYRYKEIWHQYVRLLRREDEEDCLWEWQARTWADVSRFLVNVALFELSRNNTNRLKTGLFIEQLLASAIHLFREQHLGSRISAGSEPGPFMINFRDKGRSQASVLEIVHPDQAVEHPSTQHLGRLGGHLYLVITPLAGGRRKIIIVWAVHTAGSEKCPTWEEIGQSAGRSLQNHVRNLDELRDPELPVLRGFVVASDLESKSAELHPGVGKGLHLVQVATDQRCWKDALAGITAVIEDIMEKVL